mmetsp:Transcript_104404/g.185656  ORF Transcript_104404/g.185656 Transcript_104404/m.185656 type:complete len:115 (+) Transcript_104404:41-385(+)
MMALRRAAMMVPRAVGAQRAAAPIAVQAAQVRWMANSLDDRRHALEDSYFNKEDERLMRNLLTKLKKQADVADEHRAAGQVASEKSHLMQIVEKYNMSAKDVEALLAWKHEVVH